MDLDDDDTYSANGNNEFVLKIRTKDNAIAAATDADTKFVIRPSGRVLINYGSTYQLTSPSDPYLAVNGDISSSGTITGDGSGLSNLNATNFASGTVPSAKRTPGRQETRDNKQAL